MVIVTNYLALIGNLIGLIAIIAKTIFDLVINPNIYNDEKKVFPTLKAVERKRYREKISILYTFIFIAIGYIFNILSLIEM